MAALGHFAHKLWWYVRQVSGDADYENYLRASRRKGCRAGAADSREEFYLDRLRRKYTGISRCC